MWNVVREHKDYLLDDLAVQTGCISPMCEVYNRAEVTSLKQSKGIK
jgi:hypothetical protein